MTDINKALAAPSGRFVLRMDPDLHASLREAAGRAGTSLNEYCIRRLSEPEREWPSEVGAVVDRAEGIVGEALLGVVVFGSWARQQATASSDVDVLVVMDVGFEITRGVYRKWDASPLVWDGRPVEPHFVHLPDVGNRVSGMWAEVAVDGVVLFENGFVVSEKLVAIRRKILSGKMVQRRSHGQPYWVEVA